MLRLLKYTADVPEWAVDYLINGEREGLSEEEVREVDEFVANVKAAYDVTSIDFDTELMDEKYGNFYTIECDQYPSFGRKFGACKTYKIPIYADFNVNPEDLINYTYVVTGKNLATGKDEIIIVEDQPADSVEYIEELIYMYYEHIGDLDFFIAESKNVVISQ